MIAINRRRFLEVTALGSVLAGIAPWRPAAADSKPLTLRSRRDIAVLKAKDGKIDTLQARADIKLGRYNLLTGGYEFERESYHNISTDENPVPSQRVDARVRNLISSSPTLGCGRPRGNG